jgi:choline dehydrogenase-like flavoprotein
VSVTDTRELPDGHRIGADVCIIGSGPAGLTIALELAGTGLRVAMLEGGGREFDPRVQDLYDGTVDGQRYYPLAASRLRMFGGSSNHWEGWCRPLDRTDVDGSNGPAWPLSYDELASHYPRAQQLCELPPFDYEGDTWAAEFDAPLLDVTGLPIDNGAYHRSPPTRFGERYEAELTAGEDVTLYLHANVVELVAHQQRISSVTIADLDGGFRHVTAPYVVLATGGIENARLLLASDQGHPGGLGNREDLVGRHFAEHPHLRTANVLVPTGMDLDFYLEAGQVGSAGVRGILTLDADLRRSHGIGNVTAILDAGGEDPRLPASSGVRTLTRALGGDDAGSVQMHLIGEQRMIPTNRIELSRSRDALGMRRVRLRWQLHDDDWRTLRVGTRLFATALPTTGLGPVHSSALHGRGRVQVSWGNHHLGTTRMHDDPRQGVVDRHCRVHDLENLYVAGTSVFPTGGWANPTLTVVALAARLGAHLREVIG